MHRLRTLRRAVSCGLHQHEAPVVTAATYDLGKLHGGLRLPGHKQASTVAPIRDVPIPSQLVLPITQHVGDPAQPVVAIGEHVLKGQLLAAPDGGLGAPVTRRHPARLSRSSLGRSRGDLVRMLHASLSNVMEMTARLNKRTPLLTILPYSQKYCWHISYRVELSV